MTDQEAGVLAARLERIWTRDRPRPRIFNSEVGLFLCRRIAGTVKFSLAITEEVFFCVVDTGETDLVLMQCEGLEVDSLITGLLSCDYPKGDPHVSHAGEETFEQFAEEWLPSFRRNCWLSGCDIEASAHEKAEWMQGFSREELESWNLKM